MTATPVFAGNIPGGYVLELLVETPTGGSPPDFMVVHVAADVPPVAVATADRTTIHVGETVCFDASQSDDREGGPLSYLWNFRDGSPAFFDGVQPFHTYDSVGTFESVVQVIDERNAYDVDHVGITVLPPAAVPTLPRSGLTLLALLLSLSLAGAGAIASRRARPAS